MHLDTSRKSVFRDVNSLDYRRRHGQCVDMAEVEIKMGRACCECSALVIARVIAMSLPRWRGSWVDDCNRKHLGKGIRLHVLPDEKIA